MNENNKLIITASVLGGFGCILIGYIIYRKTRDNNNKNKPKNSPAKEREVPWNSTSHSREINVEPVSEAPPILFDSVIEFQEDLKQENIELHEDLKQKNIKQKDLKQENIELHENLKQKNIKLQENLKQDNVKLHEDLKQDNIKQKDLKQERVLETLIVEEKQNKIPRVLKFPQSTTLPTPERPIPRGVLSDVEKYRCGYPGVSEDDRKSARDNYLFYKNEIPMRPKNYKIDYIHENWWQCYDELERNHSYIQWLFPIREQGVNYQANPLQLSEIQLMHKDPEILERLLLSYILMLDFYGCKIDEEGNLSRSENYVERYANLNDSSHNNLRITRILKCLGEFGFEDLKEKFMSHFIEEIWGNKKITRCKQSCRNFWLGTIRDYETRQKLIKRIIELEDR